jgi:hypothetical protein
MFMLVDCHTFYVMTVTHISTYMADADCNAPCELRRGRKHTITTRESEQYGCGPYSTNSQDQQHADAFTTATRSRRRWGREHSHVITAEAEHDKAG